MKKIKKHFAMFLTASMILSPMASVAVDGPDSPVRHDIISTPISDEVDIIDRDLVDEVQMPDYIQYKGKIVEIDKSGNTVKILVKDKVDEPFNGMLFHLTEYVTLLNGETKDFIGIDELEVGMTVTAYYHKETIMLMSLPPQLDPEVIVVNTKEEYSPVYVSGFDEELLSSDGSARLIISEDTVIVDKHGNKLDKEAIKNRDLIVFSSIEMESYPVQKIVDKIIVIERRDQVIENPVYDSENMSADIESLDKIYINGKEIKLQNNIFEDKKGVKMLPLRQIAEALGYKVTWDNNDKRVDLAKGDHKISVTIGKDNYIFAEILARLGTTPILKDSKTFVPFDFLQKVLMINVEIIDGAINIRE